jgi:hypothetical protein
MFVRHVSIHGRARTAVQSEHEIQKHQMDRQWRVRAGKKFRQRRTRSGGFRVLKGIFGPLAFQSLA